MVTTPSINDVRQAVASVTTNDIFKRIVNIASGNSKANKREFLRLLGVDMKTVEPIYFNEKVYKSNEHSECIFLFTDEEFRLYGVFKGIKWDVSFEDFEYYSKGSGYYQTNQIFKTWKTMNETAFHVLVITPGMQTLKGKIKEWKYPTNPALSEHYELVNKKNKFEERIFNFRVRKYGKISHEEVLFNLQKTISYLAENMLNQEVFEEFKEVLQKINKVNVQNIYEVIRHVVDISQRLTQNHNKWQQEIKSGEYNSTFNYFEKQYQLAKINAIKYWEKIENK